MGRPPRLLENRRMAFGVAFLLVALIAAAVALPSAQSAPRCLGKKATIARGGGNNVIQGTKGHDVIHGGGGRDRIDGRGGNDRICGGRGRDTIIGGRGSDRLAGGGGHDRIIGSRGKDRLFGGAGNDRLSGLRGSDRIEGGSGEDRLFGQSGNDRLNGGGGSDLVDGGRGDDPLVSGGPGSFDNVIGGTGNDRIDGGPGAHDIASFVTTSAPLAVNLVIGTVRGGEHERLRRFEDVLGGAGNDGIVGNAAPNRLDGGPGSDHLQAVGPGDLAYGGAGSDACVGGFIAENSCGHAPSGAVVVELVQSIDASASLVISGTGASDRVALRRSRGRYLTGVGGAPVVSGTPQACAFAGSQLIACPGRASRVQVSMGPGDDVISLRGVPRGSGATIDGGPGSDRLTGGAGNDTIYGGDDRVPDVLRGAGGDDQLFGINTSHPRKGSGAAKMFGGAGNDLLVGGQPCGGDRFVGGPGRNDSASFARVRNGGVHVRAAIGGSVSDPDAGRCNRGRISSSTEKIEGSPGPDRLFGDGSANTLLGRGGNDLLDGKGGRDRCIGGGGRDRTRSCEQSFP